MSISEREELEILTDKDEVIVPHFYQNIDYLGNLLLKSLLWLGLCFLVIQLLLHIDCIRPFLSPVYRMEGVPMDARNVKDWLDEKKSSFLHHSS
ncbi:hypothetical protein [Paenibacillus sp. GCM10028914]|uniref:hypothetical protein n=1 Tax=Paenibacillus sp. GCM10028914 TaxID=3273416 RepID=UPI003608F4E9